MLIRFFIRKARSIEVTRRFSGFYWTKGNLLSSIGSKGTEQPWTIFQGKGAWSFLYWSMIEKLFIILILMTKYQFNLLYSKYLGECIQRPIFFPLSYKLDHLPKVRFSKGWAVLSCIERDLWSRPPRYLEKTFGLENECFHEKKAVCIEEKATLFSERNCLCVRNLICLWKIFFIGE